MSRASDEAYKIIREQIVKGMLAPDTQLKEEELAQLCGVSRTPIRDALHRLEAELLVRRTETQRTFVQDWSGPELADIFALRRMVETDAAARAAELITQAEIERLRYLNEAIENAIATADGFDHESCLSANMKFHRTVLEASRSERLLKLHNQLINQAIPQFSATSENLSEVRRSLSHHHELVIAFLERDREWARSLMDSHIRQSFHLTRSEFSQSRQESARNELPRSKPSFERPYDRAAVAG